MTPPIKVTTLFLKCLLLQSLTLDIEIHKVEVLGAFSAVQKASATVPDQEHPEKYLNLDSDTVEEVVNNNLWYEDTQALKLNKIGNRRKLNTDLNH